MLFSLDSNEFFQVIWFDNIVSTERNDAFIESLKTQTNIVKAIISMFGSF